MGVDNIDTGSITGKEGANCVPTSTGRAMPGDEIARPAPMKSASEETDNSYFGCFRSPSAEKRPSSADEARLKVFECYAQAIKELSMEEGKEIRINEDFIKQCSRLLMDGKTTSSDVKKTLIDSAKDGLKRVSYKTGPKAEQKKIIDDSNRALDRYFASLGIDYNIPKTVFVPLDKLPKKSQGAFSTPLDTVFLPSEFTNKEPLVRVVLHEYIHKNASGFGIRALNEGANEYLRLCLMAQGTGVKTLSSYEIAGLALGELKRIEASGYPCANYAAEVIATAFIAEKTGLDAIQEAYLKGNESLIESAIGKGKWQAIKELAAEYPDKADESFPKKVEQFLKE